MTKGRLIAEHELLQLRAAAVVYPVDQEMGRGPDILGVIGGNRTLFGAADAPAAVMPNGHVLFAADASPTLGLFQAPTQLFDFNPGPNTLSPVAPAIPDLNLTVNPSYVTRMFLLPTGEVLFADGSWELWIYTPDGAPDPSWLPVFAQVKYNGAGVFSMRGVRMNGVSAGSSYGDDVESDENYPIVRLSNGAGNVFYARTSNWSNTGVGKPSGNETVEFTLKPGMAPGNYSMVVIRAGIASKPRCVTITAQQISGGGGAREVPLSVAGCRRDAAPR